MIIYYYKDGTTSTERDYSKDLHRIDGPAVEYANGDKSWYVDGKLHRIDGPAIEYLNGEDKHWYVDGKYCYVEIEFNKLIAEVKELPLALRLIDPREWVRKL
jgi:hypothetical protein